MRGSLVLAAICVVAAVPLSLAVDVGESYDRVISELGKPTGQMNAGDLQVLQYPGLTVRIKDGVVVAVRSTPKPAPAAPRPTPTPSLGTMQIPAGLAPDAAANARRLIGELNATVIKARKIINQPVTQVPIDPGMKVGQWTDGWFHPGAMMPHFDTADVSRTQETGNYDNHDGAGYEYGSSPATPGVAFVLKEVAFNAELKYFYEDRSVPKKKLTDAELQEINRLYRIIGEDARELVALGVTPNYDAKAP